MEDINYLKVDGHSYLMRDVRTNAIINMDKKGYDSYVSLKKSKESEKQRIEKMESDLNGLKNDIGEIKDLLKNITKNL
jgi:hypothetical protein